MDDNHKLSGLLKLQKYLVIAIVVLFSITIAAYIINRPLGVVFCYASIIILILSAPIRLLWIGNYFAQIQDHRYKILSYFIIVIIGLSALLKIVQL
jgi:hypothetical protein